MKCPFTLTLYFTRLIKPYTNHITVSYFAKHKRSEDPVTSICYIIQHVYNDIEMLVWCVIRCCLLQIEHNGHEYDSFEYDSTALAFAKLETLFQNLLFAKLEFFYLLLTKQDIVYYLCRYRMCSEQMKLLVKMPKEETQSQINHPYG